MDRTDLVQWIYRLASSKRQNDAVCAQICTEIEKGEKEVGRLSTGYCIDRVLVDEQKAWARFFSVNRYCQNPGLALAEIRHGAPWMPECDFDSVEEQAHKCIATRRYIVSTASLSSGATTGPCISLPPVLTAAERHPVYRQWLADRYRRASNGE